MINILVVEDDRQILKSCADLLSGLDIRINPIPVESAEMALDVLDRRNIDGAFIDILLPGMDGFSLADNIRSKDKYYFLPIVFATARKQDVPDTYKKYRNIDYISKPYDMEMFQSAAKRLVTEIEKQQKLSLKNTERRIPVQHDKGWIVLPYSELLYVTTTSNRKIKMVTRTGEFYLSNITLGNLITFVNETSFVQCHKACIVNVKNILGIMPYSRKTWTILFRDAPDITCPMSQKYRSEIERLLR